MQARRCVHLVEQLNKALLGQLGHRVDHRHFELGAVADQELIAGVEEGKAVLGAGQRGDGRRHLPQDLAQQRALGFELPGAGDDARAPG